MISDEERDDVIENLRFLCEGNRVRYKEEFFELLDETVIDPFYGYHEMNEVFGRLAELIDRPTCRNIYDIDADGASYNGFECSECGCKVEDGEGYPVSGVWNHCPQCGRRVVIDGHR